MNTIVFLLTVILCCGIKSCASVSCLSCPSVLRINLTTDEDLNFNGCVQQEEQICSLILRIDYTNSNDSYGLLGGIEEGILILTNGEPQVSEITFIWFNELRVQRMANIYCFSATSCGVDILKGIYRDKFRSFQYLPIQEKLAGLLYSSTAPSASLTCSDPSGSTIPCSDGFCRTLFDGNGLVQYSSCVKKGFAPIPYGLTLTKTSMLDLGGDQTAGAYTCNIPMCNSKENTQKVIQLLVEAQIIPQPTTTTTTTTVVPTITTEAPTTTRSMGIKMINNEQKLLIVFLIFFLSFKF